jgi:hypothetical protein
MHLYSIMLVAGASRCGLSLAIRLSLVEYCTMVVLFMLPSSTLLGSTKNSYSGCSTQFTVHPIVQKKNSSYPAVCKKGPRLNDTS